MSLFGQAANTTATNSTTNTAGDISKDIPLTAPPEDGISEIFFAPQQDFLSVASWDNKIRIYEVNEQGQSQGKAELQLGGPVLSTAWMPDGTKIIGAGADKSAQLFDLGGDLGKPFQVAGHDQPIKVARVVELQGSPYLVTGSWDKTVKYWDCRQQQAIATLQCQERVYTMDARNQLLVIGTADRYVNIVNLASPDKFYKTMQSPLKFQTRIVSCFTDATGFAVGSIEGRCAIQYVEEKDATLNFSFKCHRETPTTGPNRDVSQVYSVNAISFHPQHGTFSTAGSDGTFHFWDKDAKHRLKGYPAVGGTITSTNFSSKGTIFAYAVSYDWSQGYQKHTQGMTNKVMLHGIQGDETKPRPNSKKR